MATNATDPLAPHNVLQGPMTSVLSSTLIVYIADMVSREVYQQEKEKDAIPMVTKPSLAWDDSLSLSSNFRMP